MTQDLEKLYTPLEVSRMLGEPVWRIYRMLDRRQIVAYKLGAWGRRIPSSEARRLLEASGRLSGYLDTLERDRADPGTLRDYYDTKDLVKLLSCSDVLVYDAIRREGIPFSRILNPKSGKEVMSVKREDLVNWLEKKRE